MQHVLVLVASCDRPIIKLYTRLVFPTSVDLKH